MWTGKVEELSRQLGQKFTIHRGESHATYADVLDGWQNDADLRSLFIKLLKNASYSAFRWETPPITATTTNRPFEFVLLDSPELASEPDPTPFAEHLETTERDVVEFPNLGRNAVLIVPRQKGPVAAYGHLAAFVRNAPESQQHALLELIGNAMARRLGSAPVWLNTAGAGVPWLHVRLDDQPKYYHHRPYRLSGEFS